MMIPNNSEEPKTMKDKLHEPILNPIQVFAIMMTLLYEVISNIIIYAMMEEPNWTFILINLGVGVVIIVMLSLLRAAFPKEIPDRTIWAAFWLIWKQVVDVITDPKSDPDTKMNILEKSIQWDVREWDVAYQEKLSEQIEYYKSKLNDQIEIMETEIEKTDLDNIKII